MPLILLAVLSFALMACGAFDDERPLRLEDIESPILIIEEGEDRRILDSTDEFVALLPFEPIYPTFAPRDVALEGAAIYLLPAGFTTPSNQRHRGRVALGFRSTTSDDVWYSLEQTLLPLKPRQEAHRITDDVSGYLAVEDRFLDLTWRTCDRTITLLSRKLTVEEATRVAASTIDQCPD